jgi:hypothetical protein
MQVASPILITDDDKSGRECSKKAKANGELPEKYHFCWKRPRRPETELEDLLRTDQYWNSLQEQFGVTLDRASFEAAAGKWTVRMQEAFELGGKTWNTSVESNVKGAVSRCVAESPGDAVAGEHTTLVDNVVDAIVQLTL